MTNDLLHAGWVPYPTRLIARKSIIQLPRQDHWIADGIPTRSALTRHSLLAMSGS